jgi:small subunit ribosomal protein S9
MNNKAPKKDKKPIPAVKNSVDKAIVKTAASKVARQINDQTKEKVTESKHDITPSATKNITNNKSNKKKHNKNNSTYATGKRKTAIVKIWCTLQSGPINVSINKKPLSEYFKRNTYLSAVMSPCQYLKIDTGYNFDCTAIGGGLKGQAEAIRLGISKILSTIDSSYRKPLRDSFFLTRDAREVERKKPGLRKARKKEQFAKR